jgi:hypothetical protein
MRFEPDGLHITVKEEKDACVCMGVLNSEAFLEYAPTPMVTTNNNVPFLLGLLKDRVGTVDMSVVDKKFRVSVGNRSAKLSMPELKYVTSNINDSDVPVLKDDSGFDLDVSVLLDMKTTFDLAKVPFVEVKTESGKLKLIVGEDTFDQVTTDEKVDYKDAAGIFGNVLIEIVKVLEGKVNITFDNDYPMVITERGEDYSVKWLVAPMEKV